MLIFSKYKNTKKENCDFYIILKYFYEEIFIFINTILLFSCSNPNNESKDSKDNKNLTIDNIYNESFGDIISLEDLDKNKSAKKYFLDEYQDSSFDDKNLINGYLYENNSQVDLNIEKEKKKDYKSIFYNSNSARVVNISDGYAFTYPTSTTIKGDFSLGEYRSKIYNKESTLTISVEDQNPYGNDLDGWETYRDEWITIYLERDQWYSANNVSFTREKRYEDTSIIDGYSIIEYDLKIENNGNISKNFYNICILRKANSYNLFYLFVMKSSSNRNEDFDKILKSFNTISSFGKPNNSTYYKLSADNDPNWDEATKNYYEKLQNQNYTDWGCYNGNLPFDSEYQGHCEQEKLDAYDKKQKQVNSDFEYDFDVISSYNHVSWHGDFSVFYFPLVAANKFCGDGNDKPILQFSYQYTDNNNNLSENSAINLFSPQFDVLRGKDSSKDDSCYQNGLYNQLVQLAQAIKEYGKPMMFRLNNEMNTDWCSYCGLNNLLDPDLFQAGWRILFNIFKQEGVKNVIWIFNPFTPSYPYSRWGREICYFPGNEYVHVIGLTYYVMNNSNEAENINFKKAFYDVYSRNSSYFTNYPWYISEFGCGSGNNNYQYEASQTAYIENMWECLNTKERTKDFKNIKGAIWFNCNDYKADGSIQNALSFYKKDGSKWAVKNSANAFIKGLKEQIR